VAVVGRVEGAPRRWRRLDARGLAPADLARAPAVVLGDEAVDVLQPVAILAVAPPDAVVLQLRRTPAATADGWRRLGAVLVADGAALVLAVRERLAATGGRLPMPLAEWCGAPPPPGSAAWTALAVVPRLAHPYRVAAWHGALKWSYRQLHDLARDDLEASPLDVLWWYVAAEVRGLRSEGRTLAQVARRLGFHDAAALHHAWTGRGLGPPPPAGVTAPPQPP
jgi:hypothetical protein